MLLTSLIGSFQNQYADIQAQIEELQEQQRKIQAYLQQLGSVESQMVSAVQMLQEAIASINEVCPDQLAEYQETVVGLFSVPVAALEASQPEPQPETQPDPNPEPSQPDNVAAFPKTIDVTADVTATNATETEPKQEQEEVIQTILEYTAKMGWNEYKKYISQFPLPRGIHQQKREQVQETWRDYLQTVDTPRLFKILDDLK